MSLPKDPKARKAVPIGTGVLDYFPDAIAAVAEVSRVGNDQHNPGQPLGWSRGKSSDHWDCLLRHGLERGTIDTDDVRHTAKLAWRALALLQEELEAAGAPLSRGSRVINSAPSSPSLFIPREPSPEELRFIQHHCKCGRYYVSSTYGWAAAVCIHTLEDCSTPTAGIGSGCWVVLRPRNDAT